MFYLTDEQKQRVQDWLKEEVYPVIIKEQKARAIEYGTVTSIHEHCWKEGYPYEGAIGGGLTYEFTPTSIGIIEKVRYTDRFELDLTDYGSW